MSNPLLLLRRGPAGLSAELVEFDRLELPASPNTCLAGPAEYAGPKHLTTPPFAVPPATLWARLLAVAAAQPRTWRLGEWPEPLQAEWVERTPLMNYPDLISAEIRPAAQGSALLLYSRSLFGWSDLGVNKARVERWLRALTS